MAEDLRRFLSDRTSHGPAEPLARRLEMVSSKPLAVLSVLAAALAVVTSVASTVAYVRTSSALQREVAALREVDRERRQVVAERNNARQSLYHSLLGEARATRLARQADTASGSGTFCGRRPPWTCPGATSAGPARRRRPAWATFRG
ncbi:MAG: hypothetical protein U0835_15930 [Isosphaeraceae bacterium]